jgi:ribonuclease HII
VVLPEDFPLGILGDSKQLSPARREAAMRIIYQKALAWGIGWASSEEIDRINILQASLLAMRRAFLAMENPAAGSKSAGRLAGLGEAVADGLYTPDIPISCRALVKADSLVPEVMAASILAKTARDRMMIRYSWLYPEYGYDKHKGYPTKAHREAIERHGPSPIQRMSFRVGK